MKKPTAETPLGRSMEYYDCSQEKTVIHGFIIVIDSVDWKEPGGAGVLFVQFDIRSSGRRVIERGQVDEEWGVFEQLEASTTRQDPSSGFTYHLKKIWNYCGGSGWKEVSQQQQGEVDPQAAVTTTDDTISSVIGSGPSFSRPSQAATELDVHIANIKEHAQNSAHKRKYKRRSNGTRSDLSHIPNVF